MCSAVNEVDTREKFMDSVDATTLRAIAADPSWYNDGEADA